MPFVAAVGAAAPPSNNRVMTVQEWCERAGVSRVTGWRIIKRGGGPKITQVSLRRIGVREDHFAEWLDTLEVRHPSSDIAP